jgi:hypothetical protein
MALVHEANSKPCRCCRFDDQSGKNYDADEDEPVVERSRAFVILTLTYQCRTGRESGRDDMFAAILNVEEPNY